MIKKINKGYTLIELMVVVAIFSIIALVASETIILTLRGTTKAEAISKVRQNIDYAMGSMERQLRGAKSVTSTCNNVPSTQISFIDQNNNAVTFSCVNVNSTNQLSSIASSSANLTSGNISISQCSFSCTPKSGNKPAYIQMTIVASDLKGENAITDTTQVTLRSY